MYILIIGGTGAMGAPLAEYLGGGNNDIDIVVRFPKNTKKHIKYIKADAFDYNFMSKLVEANKYDVIIDFMIYELENYKNIVTKYLQYSSQYICFSTCSVYGENIYGKIDENTTRLYDTYSEERKSNMNIYHIKKSVIDDILISLPYSNWTMVRPYITFNTKKLPLVTYPKEVWLYRVLNNKEIVLPKDVMQIKTTLSYGKEVAYGISKLVGNKKAFKEIINIASDISMTWADLVEIYQNILPKICNKSLKIKYVETSDMIWKYIPGEYDLYKYDRLLNREFNISKLKLICGEDIKFGSIKKNIEKALNDFFEMKDYKIMPNPQINGYMDRITHEWTSLNEFKTLRLKVMYLKNRIVFINILAKICKKCLRKS